MRLVSSCLVISNNYAELEKIGKWIKEIGENWDLQPSVTYNLDVCADEALMNVISYAYDDARQHKIVVHLSRLDSMIKLEIIDDGNEFVPDYSAPPLDGLSIADAPIGGLGIHLMHCLMDECNYHRRDGNNFLTLTLKLD